MEEPKNPDGIRVLADESENGEGGEGRPGPQDYGVAADAAIGFEITAAARRRDPALAQSVERTLWERFNKNADNLRRAVKQAGKTQQRISL